MLKLEKISVIFNKGTANEITALDNISIDIDTNQFLTIVGSNGSGKSTLMNVIAGSQQVNSGAVIINDVDVTSNLDFERAKYISRLFQNPLWGTAPDLSIIDNLRLATNRPHLKRLRTGIDNSYRRLASEKLSLLGMDLENKMDQLVGNLSGGQRQALTLIMAIMAESKILLLDEPTAALDPKSSQFLMQHANTIIKEHKLTAIFITHNLKDAFQYGNRLVVMSEGKIIKDLQAEEKAKLKPEALFEMIA